MNGKPKEKHYMSFANEYHPDGISQEDDPVKRLAALKRAENALLLGKGDCAKLAARRAGTTCKQMLETAAVPRHGAITEGELEAAAQRRGNYSTISDGRRRPQDD